MYAPTKTLHYTNKRMYRTYQQRQHLNNMFSRSHAKLSALNSYRPVHIIPALYPGLQPAMCNSTATLYMYIDQYINVTTPTMY